MVQVRGLPVQALITGNTQVATSYTPSPGTTVTGCHGNHTKVTPCAKPPGVSDNEPYYQVQAAHHTIYNIYCVYRYVMYTVVCIQCLCYLLD